MKKLTRNCDSCGVLYNGYGKKYCKKKCQHEHSHKIRIKERKEGLHNGRKGELSISKHIRRHLHKRANSKCEICSWGETNTYTGKIPLEIDHIDGNYMNNEEINLRLICPNCHSLTSTFRALNKGKGRASRNKLPE